MQSSAEFLGCFNFYLAWTINFLSQQILNNICMVGITSAKKSTLRSVSPHSPCAPDVPGAYNVNSCSGCVHLGSFHLDVKGPCPMRPDPFDPRWCSHPPDTLPPAPSLFIPSLPIHPFPCCPFADFLRPPHLSTRPPPPIPPPARFLSMIPSLL